MNKSITVLGAAMALAISSTPVTAQDYSPDIIELGETGPFAFEAAPQLDLSDGGAVEFWVAPSWSADPGFDPPVLLNIGPKGISYLISVMRERDGLVFANDTDEDVFLADLTDGNLHHVAINVMDDGLEVYVDGLVVGTSDLKPSALPSSGLYVGGLGVENTGSFKGAIGQLRFWKEPLYEEDIIAYRMRDVLDAQEGDHPDAANLAAMSDLATGQMLLVDAIGEAE